MATLKVKVSILIFVLIMCSMLGFVGIIIQGGEHLIEVGNVECFSQKQLNTRNILMNDTEPPVADAGENMIVNEDTIFILDGSNSTDDIGIVNFTWTGWTIVGEDSGRAIPECIGTWYGESVEVVVNEPDTYKFLVKVMDIGNNSNEDWINVTVRDITPPIVQFGFTDWSIDQHETFSYKFPNPDVDGEWWCQDNVGVVNYTWTMECIEWYGNRPDSIVSHNESFECILDDVGKYRFIVNVSDAAGNTDNDFTLGRVKDVDLPIADAG